MYKKILLSGYFGYKNFGDEAILSVLVSNLSSLNYDLSIITANPEYTQKKFNNINTIQTFDIKNIIKEIKQTDMLISGGGSLLQDVTSLKSLLYYLFIIMSALFYRKKVIIFAQGIGPINSKIGRFLVRTVLKRCNYISVRDIQSKSLLDKWHIPSDLVQDPVFSYKIPQQEKEEILAIQLREFKTMPTDFVDKLAKKISSEFADTKINIFSFQDKIDLQICKKLKNAINKLDSTIKIDIFSNLSDNEITTQFAKAKYLIAMRFHAIIIGLLSSCKTIAINYDIKVENLTKDFDIPKIDLETPNFEKISQLKSQQIININKPKKENFNWNTIKEIIES